MHSCLTVTYCSDKMRQKIESYNGFTSIHIVGSNYFWMHFIPIVLKNFRISFERQIFPTRHEVFQISG